MSLDFLIHHLLNLDWVQDLFRKMEGLTKKRTMKLAFLDSIRGLKLSNPAKIVLPFECMLLVPLVNYVAQSLFT